MAVMKELQLVDFLEEQTQETWLEMLEKLNSSIHRVDRDATKIWFAFWPLELHEALGSTENKTENLFAMDIEGQWELASQIDSTVSFLYGAHYWVSVKTAVIAHKTACDSLEGYVWEVAGRVAETEDVDVGLVLGISVIGLLMLRFVGRDALSKVVDSPVEGKLLSKDPEKVVKERERESRDGWFTFLKGDNRRWIVRWGEGSKDKSYRAINKQDLAMAAAEVNTDYRSLDYRRVDGPIPVECRIGSCGYCWVGILAGRGKLSEMTNFERDRLRYFGYDAVNGDDNHPLIRLACQAQCLGDITLTIPPWNGELQRRHDEGRKKLGTA